MEGVTPHQEGHHEAVRRMSQHLLFYNANVVWLQLDDVRCLCLSYFDDRSSAFKSGVVYSEMAEMRQALASRTVSHVRLESE